MAASKIAPGLLTSFYKEINEAVVNGINIPEELLKQLSPESAECLQKNIKTSNYWNRRLASEVDKFTVIFGLISLDGLCIPDMSIVLDYVEKLISLKTIRTVYTSENRNFVGISFYNEESVKLMYEKIHNMGPQTVIYLGNSNLNTFNTKILWATPQMKIEDIMENLSDVIEEYDLDFNKIHKNGIDIPTTEIVGTITLKKEKSLKDVPHMSNVKGYTTRKVLLLIKGRASVCLKCQEEGHIRRTCPKIYCRSCHSLHLPTEKCQQKSYASVTKQTGSNKSNIENQFTRDKISHQLYQDPWDQVDITDFPEDPNILYSDQLSTDIWEEEPKLISKDDAIETSGPKNTNKIKAGQVKPKNKSNLFLNLKEVTSKPTTLKRPNSNIDNEENDNSDNPKENNDNPSKKSHPYTQELSDNETIDFE